MAKKKLRFGVLSTARIGVEKVIPAMQQGELTEVTAIASRSIDTARQAAERLGLAQAFGSYEELLASPEVDAVYIPLPNEMHVPWSLRALAAGKHVLCEKPIGLDSAEAQQLLEGAAAYPHLKVMEAFMYRFNLQWIKARELVTTGSIGTLKTIQTFFSFYNDNAGDIRNRPHCGGGALWDIGCYCVSLSRFLFDAEPDAVLGQIERDPRFGTDVVSSGILRFGRFTSTFTCGTLLAPYQRVHIVGDRGRVEIEIPFNAPMDRPCRLWLQQGDSNEEILMPVCNQYTRQGDLFAQAVLENRPVPTPLTDAVANMRVLDALVRSADQGGWEQLA